MIQDQKPLGWYVTGFHRYRPENRISRSMVAAAPWANVALLIAMYLYLLAPNVQQPGMTVHLPESPFVSGTRYGHNVVVLSQETAGSPTREEIVFFDDRRYLVRQPAQMDELRAAFARAAREQPNLPMVVEADVTVQHGTMIQLLNMASDAGMKEVNVATRPTESP
jgi:biopolymer transport protein ExbD